MAEVRYIDTRTLEYQEDSRFAGIGVKLLETRTTHPTTSVVVARVAPGGTIPQHTHAVETETAYVLSGQGMLITEAAEYVFEPGIAVTIPAGLAHRLVNTGTTPLEILAVHSPPTR
jgi:quercetin dioxygenase-like cupin family protein